MSSLAPVFALQRLHLSRAWMSVKLALLGQRVGSIAARLPHLPQVAITCCHGEIEDTSGPHFGVLFMFCSYTNREPSCNLS
ncbi:hypothetical protein D7006_14190 [Xanthobacter sp. YC-JY1]|nr:hypothetical protein D7006_14190 [Xanthobacter sp. YC-JY1]